MSILAPFEVTARPAFYDRVGEDAYMIHAILVGIYSRVYDEMRQASLVAGVQAKQDPDALHQHCKERSQEHIRLVLRLIPAPF